MNFVTFSVVFAVGIASVKCYTENSNLTEDGCNHFRRLHGTAYRWSCEKTLFCPKKDVDLILKLHTVSELSCGKGDSTKICCPKSMLIGSTRAKRAADNDNGVFPAFATLDYIIRQRNTAPQNSVWPIYSTQRTNFERNAAGGSSNYVPDVRRAPQNVYIDCKTLDSGNLNDSFTWSCQTGPCQPRPQSYFVKNNFSCSRSDASKICCPEFVKKIDTSTRKAPVYIITNIVHSSSPSVHSNKVDEGTETVIRTSKKPAVTGEQPIRFTPKPESTLATAVRTSSRPFIVKPTTTSDEVLGVRGFTETQFSKFDRDLLSALSKDNPRKNVVVSPASVKVLLALLAEGSRGDTSDEILNALRLKNTAEGVRSSLRKLQSVLHQGNTSNINLESRSRIYVAHDVTVLKEYLKTINNHYDADVSEVDFADAEFASKVINSWVNNVTHGLIPTLVEKENLNEDTLVYLLNYIYLKAKWDKSFDSSLTVSDCFYSQDKQCEKVKFMFKKRLLNYTDSPANNAEVFEIPFKDSRYRAVFVVPYPNYDVDELLQNLDRLDLFQLFNKYEEISVTLQLPRTTVELSTNLVRTLQQLNITTVFGPKANLEGMLKSKALVNDIVHKARIEFNEEGATGAAVSGGGIQVLSLDLDQKIVVNRPYLFFIRDTTVADGFLFEGVIYSPTKAGA